jgi:hypothetical protein
MGLLIDNRQFALPVLLSFTFLYVYFHSGSDCTLITDRLYIYNEWIFEIKQVTISLCRMFCMSRYRPQEWWDSIPMNHVLIFSMWDCAFWGKPKYGTHCSISQSFTQLYIGNEYTISILVIYTMRKYANFGKSQLSGFVLVHTCSCSLLL